MSGVLQMLPSSIPVMVQPRAGLLMVAILLLAVDPKVLWLPG